MRRTPLKPKQAEFSKKCHYMAREEVYPILFSESSLILGYDYGFGSEMDRKEGIDVTIKVKMPEFREPLNIWVQERFRKYNKTYINKNDVTFTTWNKISNLPSEWYKFKAFFMVYGFAAPDENSLFNWSVVCIPVLQWHFANGLISSADKRGNDRDQNFITFRNDDMYRLGILTKHHNVDIGGKDAGGTHDLINIDKLINLVRDCQRLANDWSREGVDNIYLAGAMGAIELELQKLKLTNPPK